MAVKEVKIGQRKFLVGYAKDEKEMESIIENQGQVIMISYDHEENEFLSDKQIQKIIDDNQDEIFLKLEEILNSNCYENADFTTITYSWEIGTTSHWHIGNCVTKSYIVNYNNYMSAKNFKQRISGVKRV
ncbi:hypothetical protein [Flavobacterium johnsoniae]|uniref:Uncharacterized protein n=1 Tax=Flavobacterium johnsoniae (strain ATCC 17061 / DSM 2064 / JCM 8514 / BCRC 14874 / CCUG 350202 / NBRC 14942 / NCIMB 11054 / UW101) TaxID=376686 RepID=A5FGD7_FLAJ1|nr:hypothetical protein [Flavobacterium johnsoniae]ABQ05726.1 hypothetical protein Fjoh_2704 [Flavobacterium johnsoniae UW101]OXE95310.1 hypothetical protein B0A63_24935 [Flavobacterium johnsoniae UW101]WQG81463.1 hypothetical protein SR927_26050 [Flavobacterium johnsoniae UW101]SHM04993.1 hypothetical protein SAMN05444146_5262 [Flavobacterium johnsoniae]